MMFDIYGESKFEKELLSNPDVLNLVMDLSFASNLYASLCNVQWKKGDEIFSSSWRYAGGFVAHLRNVSGGLNEDYLDFYCSGGEGTIFSDVKDVLEKLGWSPIYYDE